MIFYETSTYDPNDPYYPINDVANRELFEGYIKLADKDESVIIGGRLGEYTYYDMDKVILAALNCYEEKIVRNSR